MRAQTRPPDDVLLIDSAATPEVRAVIARAAAAPDVDVLVLGRNGGSAGGFGAGLEAAAARPGCGYVLAFDDDAVPAPDCLERLLAVLDGLEDVGAVGATSRAPSGDLAWTLWVDAVTPVADLAGLRGAARGRAAVPVAELAWHALLIPASVIRTHGGPWQELFMWYEDVEWGLRIRGAGLTLYVVPEAQVTHPLPPRTVHRSLLGVDLAVPVTDRRKSYLMVRNSLVVRHRHCGRRFWWADLPLTLARAVVVAFALPGPRWPAVRDVLLRGVADAVRGRLGPPPFAG